MLNDDTVYVLYAVLAGLTAYVALLAMFGRRLVIVITRTMALSWLCLAVAFACLSLGRAQVLGIKHGSLVHVTRGAFIGYGLCLLASIARYWFVCWRAPHNK